MTDRVSAAERSRMMAKVRNRDTAPEIAVRKILHAAGYRFRLHRRDLPGHPDIVLPRHRKVIFVHGCFWHGHNCPRGKRPTTNTEFWNAKLDKNIARDAAACAELKNSGWSVLIVWECQTKDRVALTETLLGFLSEKSSE